MDKAVKTRGSILLTKFPQVQLKWERKLKEINTVVQYILDRKTQEVKADFQNTQIISVPQQRRSVGASD